MTPYQFLPKLSNRIGLLCGVLLSKYAHDAALAIQTDSGLGRTTVLVVVMLVTVVVVRAVISLLIDTSFQRIWLIRRLLLGRWFVEGVWIEMVRFQGNPFSISVVHISPSDYSLKVSGSNYHLDGTPLDTWRSDMIEIDWPIMKCKHSNQKLAGKQSRLEGYGELQFADTVSRPERYNGFFCHFTEDTRYTVEAIRAHRQDRHLLNKVDGIQKVVAKFSKCFAPVSEVTGEPQLKYPPSSVDNEPSK